MSKAASASIKAAAVATAAATYGAAKPPVHARDMRLHPLSHSACMQCIAMDARCYNFASENCDVPQRDGVCALTACDCSASECYDTKKLAFIARELKQVKKINAETGASNKLQSWMHVTTPSPTTPTRSPTRLPTDDPCTCTGVADFDGYVLSPEKVYFQVIASDIFLRLDTVPNAAKTMATSTGAM